MGRRGERACGPRRRRGRHEGLGRPPVVDKWTFSTNGIATCGLFGVPTIGFGPANEVHAHTPEDQCPVEHLTLAAQFYALFSQEYLKSRA